MGRENEILEYINSRLEGNNELSTKDVMNDLNVTKQEILIALYGKGGYCITGALVDYGTISKLKNESTTMSNKLKTD